MSLPPFRRIVTGHTPSGSAVVESDTQLTPLDPVTQQPSNKTGGFTLLWRTPSIPAPIMGPWEDFHGVPLPLVHDRGTTLRAVDFPPGLSSPMHRTVSLDFGVVLEGEVVLEMDEKKEVIISKGDIVVQRGKSHAWHNRTAEWARMLYVFVPAEQVKLEDGTALAPTKFEIN